MNSKIVNNAGFSDKLLSKVILAASFSLLGGFIGYKFYINYKKILRKNEMNKYLRDIELKNSTRGKKLNDEVNDSFLCKLCVYMLVFID